MSAQRIESLVLVVALTLVTLDGAVGHGMSCRHDVESRNEGVERSAHEVVEREAILALVRMHRRGDDEQRTRRLAEAVYDESVRAGVDPLLVASIVAKESSFRSAVVSRAGAVGLMQLRPFVARDVAQRHGLEWEGRQSLEVPRFNLRLGILYYEKLVDRYDGDARLALAAYHRGPSRLSRQLRQGTFLTSRYAEGVLELYHDLDAQREGRLALASEAAPSVRGAARQWSG